MTVTTTTIKNSYSGNGSTTAFSYTFKAFASSEVKVFVRTDSTGAESLRTEGSGSTNYAVSGVGATGGGTVTFVTAPASGETVVIRRLTALQQQTDYQPADPFPASSHEDALDTLTHITQELQEELDRSFKVSRTNSITTPEFVDDASTRASKLLGFSSDGNTLEATTGRVSSVSVSNVAVSGGASQAATVSFNDTTGALALGIPVGSTGATGATGAAGDMADPTTTQHDIIVRGASAVERLAKGSNSTVLNTNASGALAYSTVSTAMIADDAVTAAKVASDAVIEASIADNAVTLAKMAGIARGKIIVGDASGNPSVIGPGTSGQALVSDGTDVAFGAVGGAGLTLLGTGTASDSASLAFTSMMTSTYTVYLMVFEALLPATNGTLPYLYLSEDNGSSYTTSDMRYIVPAVFYVGSGSPSGNSGNSEASGANFWRLTGGTLSNAANQGMSGHVWIYDTQNNSSLSRMAGTLIYSSDTTHNQLSANESYGNTVSATDKDAVKVEMNSGNIASGTVKLYGVVAT